MSIMATEATRATTPASGMGVLVEGLVQGVGFRPFVHRLAADENLAGWVRNSGASVEIAVFGAPPALENFSRRLRADAPPLARLTAIRERRITADPPRGFAILPSRAGARGASATPDAALCAACRAELLDPASRRYRHPFISCTDCGPRFSIQTGIPYDRALTSMARFAMCRDCAREYGDPADRRHHAQPIACHACGPMLWFERTGDPEPTSRGDAAIEEAQAILRAGGILAIKGIGGFHLACDALDEGAIDRLRARKRRPGKPFALMARDMDVASRFAKVDAAARAVMEGAAAPIVLLDRRPDSGLPANLTPGLGRIGIMLPYSGLHALLLAPFDHPLVMTSANASAEPQVIDNAEARERLADYADAFLLHDRDIINRADDSLVEIDGGRPRVLRRARGYAPAPVLLPPGFPADHPSVVATGGDLKNAFALAGAGSIVLAPHGGELESPRALEAFEAGIIRFEELFGIEPGLVAIDAHPGYRSSRFGASIATDRGMESVEVLHHHAHASSVMVEAGLPLDHPPVLALVQDGIGLGPDGALWGAELLLADYRAFRRLTTLKAAPLPGGDRAAVEPWRNLVARLNNAFGAPEGWPALFRERLRHLPVEALSLALGGRLATPLASSAGRLFDAVAAALGLCLERQTYEGEAAMRLQQAAETFHDGGGIAEPYSFDSVRADGQIEIDPAPIWGAIAKDLDRGLPVEEIAARFHAGWIESWSSVVTAAALELGTSPKVVLAGGVMQNRLVACALAARLDDAGFVVLRSSDIPVNDGGIAVGQIAVALARHAATR